MNRLLNKVAIITGADGGICGKADVAAMIERHL